MKNGGFLVISLDFELMWGMFDKVTTDTYGENLKGTHQAIPEILDVFSEHDIHATWATVGMLMCRNTEEFLSCLPKETLRPHYPNMAVSAYKHIELNQIAGNTTEDVYHFATPLVKKIIQTPNQELGTHTFSHYYCIDGKDNLPSVFEADLKAQTAISQTYGVTPTSMIFPRNQTTEDALIACVQNGITAYRGNENHFLYRDGTESPLYIRMLRLLDAYIYISGHNTTSIASTANTNTLHNIPSSRFLRPYSKRLRLFESMRLKRIKNSMTYAAKHNEIFHLWWHPHNFGMNRNENILNLRDLIAHFSMLRETYGMQSRNMQEISETASAVTK